MSKSLKNFFTIRELLQGGSTMKLSEEESITLPPYTARQVMMHAAIALVLTRRVRSRTMLQAVSMHGERGAPCAGLGLVGAGCWHDGRSVMDGW